MFDDQTCVNQLIDIEVSAISSDATSSSSSGGSVVLSSSSSTIQSRNTHVTYELLLYSIASHYISAVDAFITGKPIHYIILQCSCLMYRIIFL